MMHKKTLKRVSSLDPPLKKEEEAKKKDSSSPLLEDEDIVKNCRDEDQLLESSHEEVIVEGSSIEDFVKEAKEEDISSPMLEKGGAFNDEDEGVLESESKEVHGEDLEIELKEKDQETLIEESEKKVS